MADDKKTILFDVQVTATEAIKQMQKLQTEIDKLKVEEMQLQAQMKQAKYGTEEYKRLEKQLIANKQAQKAYGKEMREIERGVQNQLIAQSEKYKNTLKGLAAQLSIEKDKLRAIALEEGKLSDAYIRQEKVVRELNDQVKEMEAGYGVHTRNVGNYKSALEGARKEIGGIRMALIAVAAVATKVGREIVRSTQTLSDEWEEHWAGMKAAYQQFVTVLSTGEGWSQLIANIKQAYSNGKKFARMLDEIFERNNSLRIAEAEMSEEIERNRIAARNTTLSYKERLTAAENVIKTEARLAAMREDVAKQEMEANRGLLQEKTKLDTTEIDAYINQYENNRNLIRQAQDYLKLQREVRQTAMSGKIIIPGSDEDKQWKEANAKLKEIQDGMSDELRQFIEIAKKYNKGNDELVSGYVESYVKWKEVNADFQRANARTLLKRDQMLKEVVGDEITNYRNALDEEQKRQEQALKAQEQAMKSYAKAVTSVYNNVVESMMTDTERQVKAVKDAYYQQELSLREQVQNGMMSFEEATYWRVALAQMAANEIAKINEDAAEKERQDQLRADQQAAADRQKQLQTDLQIAWNNEDEKFRIRKEYLEKELDIENITAERRAELEQQLTELMQDHLEQRLDLVMDYANRLNDALGAIHDIQQNRADAELQDYETKQEQEKAALDKRLKAGAISQRQYDDKVAKLDTDLAQKKAQLTREQAERERVASLFSVALNTAQAIMKVWSEVPVVAAPAMTAVVAAIGALQTAAILSQPLPKARKGGAIEGPTHEGGGVLVETEGGERIVAKEPARVFPELLNLISYIGKHAGVPDTGYAARNMIGGADLDYDKIKEAMKEAVAEVQVYLALTELRDAQQTQVQIEELAKQ